MICQMILIAAVAFHFKMKLHLVAILLISFFLHKPRVCNRLCSFLPCLNWTKDI